MANIHATAIRLKNKGVLFIGASSSGKSDLALRAIINHKAKLVSDDRVEFEGGYARPAKNIEGLLEVRGVEIIKLPYIKKQKIHLVVELVDTYERLPEAEFYQGIKKIKLNPFEQSVFAKILVALKKAKN